MIASDSGVTDFFYVVAVVLLAACVVCCWLAIAKPDHQAGKWAATLGWAGVMFGWFGSLVA